MFHRRLKFFMTNGRYFVRGGTATEVKKGQHRKKEEGAERSVRAILVSTVALISTRRERRNGNGCSTPEAGRKKVVRTTREKGDRSDR